LRQAELRQDPVETNLAEGAEVTFKARERHCDMAGDPLADLGKQEPLFMDRQKHIELPARNAIQDKGEIGMRIGSQRRTAMELADESGKAPEAMRVRIADLDMVAAQTQRGDGFAR